jgi:hypothetical protein
MTLPAAYKKTPKGEEEIATRGHRLSARERSVLVMADGKTSGLDLAKRAAALGDPDVLLGALIEGGFIEPIGQVTPSEPVAAFGAVHREASRFAARYLLEALGPASDILSERVETCRDPMALIVLFERCREAIQAGAGKKKAEEFWAGLTGRLFGSS